MFNLQGSELFIILLLALVVLGPEKLPEAMRKLGEFAAQMKKMSAGFQQEFKNAVDEPMREVRDTATLLRDSVDFRKLQDGERAEKPKSAEMASSQPADQEPQVPTPPFIATSHRSTGPVDPPLEVPVESPEDAAAIEPPFDAPVDILDGDPNPAPSDPEPST